LTDTIQADENNRVSVGHLLLSPTRTYAPLLKKLFETQFEDIHGLIHCSGGGQTKCLNYLPGSYRIVKDNLFTPPAVFEIIRKASGSDNREMYQVFNMGHRLELFAAEKAADAILAAAAEFGIEAQIVGRVEKGAKKELIIRTENEEILF